jgi:uncharacterized protein with PhoU and TrkA domain
LFRFPEFEETKNITKLLVDVLALSSFSFRQTKSFQDDVLQLELGLDDVG